MRKSFLIFMITITFFFILDIFVLLDTFYYLRIPQESFWYFHLGLGVLFLLVNWSFFQRDLAYFDIMILLFPVVGFGGILFVEAIPKVKGDIHEIEETTDLKSYVKDRKEIDYIDLEVELGTMSAYDSLTTGTPQEKKKFLIEFTPPETNLRIDVLKMALQDEDIDVIHYAATEINRIDEEIQSEILKLEEEGSEEELCKKYNFYIASGLLEGEVLEFYQKKVLNLLNRLRDRGTQWEIDMLTLLKDMGRRKECRVELEKLLEETPDREVLDFAFKFYYEEYCYEEIERLRDRFGEGSIRLPFHLRKALKEESYG